MHDVVTPNFHKLRNKGKIINSPMDRTVTVLKDPLCSLFVNHEFKEWEEGCSTPVWKRHVVTRQGTRPSSVYTGGVAGMLDPPSIDIESLKAQALAKAHANVSQTSAQGLVMAAEGKKTVLSLVSIFLRLIKILRKVKRLDVRGLANELSPKELADRYMELRYALRPLMYDTVDVIQTLNTSNPDGERPRVTFRAFASASDSDSDEVPYLDDWGAVPYYWARKGTLVKTVTRNVEVRAGVLTEIMNVSGLATWGMFDPIEAVWELIPFSFIVDWFINVGDTIGSITPNYGLNELASWLTVTDTVYRETALTATYGVSATGDEEYVPIDMDFYIKGAVTSELTVTKTRIPNPSKSYYPTFTLNLDALKLADLVIIVKNLFSRR
jgi:hypothetical protein